MAEIPWDFLLLLRLSDDQLNAAGKVEQILFEGKGEILPSEAVSQVSRTYPMDFTELTNAWADLLLWKSKLSEDQIQEWNRINGLERKDATVRLN